MKIGKRREQAKEVKKKIMNISYNIVSLLIGDVEKNKFEVNNKVGLATNTHSITR